MGAWGGGLYDSDYARDLKGLIAGVWRAPLSENEIVREIGAPVASSPDDIAALDHWLVLADMFERGGLPRSDLFDRAIAIIETGQDLAALAALDTGKSAIEKRRKANAELLLRLRDPRPAKPRRPLTKPQPLLFELHDALAWPTDEGACINPYVAPEKLHLTGGFTQNGWGFGIVSAVGHLYDVLAWHSIQALEWGRPERPSPGDAAQCPRSEHHYGTMSPQHCERLKVERLGTVSADALGPPQDPELARSMARKAALTNVGLSAAFGWGAHRLTVWPGPKFMFSAPAPGPAVSRGADGDDDDDDEFVPLAPNRPATRDYYFELMRQQAR